MNRESIKIDRKNLMIRVQACMSASALKNQNADDMAGTELMLFTAEGLLRAYNRSIQRGICHVESVVDCALLRWLALYGKTNRLSEQALSHHSYVLSKLRELKKVRTPLTPDVINILKAIQQKQNLGVSTVNHHDSNLVLCSMTAVAALGANLSMSAYWVCEQAVDIVALTHTHPKTKLKSGFTAVLFHQLFCLGSKNFKSAIETAAEITRSSLTAKECLDFTDVLHHLSPELDAIEKADSDELSWKESTPSKLTHLVIELSNDLCDCRGWPGEYDPAPGPECRSHLYPPV